MTELRTSADGDDGPAASTESAPAEPTVAAEDFHPDVAPAPAALITEQEVRFGTAAALNRPAGAALPTRRRHSPRRGASYHDVSPIPREGLRL